MGAERDQNLKSERRGRGWARVLAAVVLAMVALNLAGVPRTIVYHWGLPDATHCFSYHPDEIMLLMPSFGFSQGDWNPHFFNYGTLYIYLVGIPAVLSGHLADPSRFPADLRPLYELGRGISVWMGAATVFLLCFCLRRESRWLALLSALLLALCPLHIVNSGYATVDVPATFWLVVAFALALWGLHRPNLERGFLAGFAVGLAAATKYSAGLFIVPALLALTLERSTRGRWPLYVTRLLGGACGFALACPFFWTAEFWQGVLFEARHMRVGGTTAFVDTGPGWIYHLTRGLPAGLGYALLAAAALGVIGAVRTDSRAARISLLWVVFYLFVIGFAKERFIRYLVPLTPFVCVLAASGVMWLYRLARTRPARVAVVAYAAGVVALTGIYASGQVARFTEFDPRDRAWAEVGKTAIFASGSQLRVGLVQAPWYCDPPVSALNSGPFTRKAFEEWNAATGERVVVTGWDAEMLARVRPEMFFVSDAESSDWLRLREPKVVRFMEALERIYARRSEYARPAPRFSWLAPPRAWAPPDWLYPNPHITMYYRPRPKDQ